MTELEELIMINQTDNFVNLGKYLATERPGHESFESSELLQHDGDGKYQLDNSVCAALELFENAKSGLNPFL